MEKFLTLTGVSAPLALDNVDTDKILPAQFLKTIKRAGLGTHLFEALRYDGSGRENPDFVLNQAKFRHARMLIAGANFGCGSSREHAPWALLDFGIRCVIAPSFADIFHANCFKNAILPIVLPRNVCETLQADAASSSEPQMTVDLARQVILPVRGNSIGFAIDEFRKHCLIQGLDDIDLTLQRAPAIDAYEQRLREDRNWLPAITGS
jgi:3-isopropylmalate/(R)-2-methylmalate dehydratase small subunit